MIRRRVPALVALVLATAATRAAHAYDPLTWHSIDGGGAAFVTEGTYKLGGTIGQTDAGRLAGGGFALRGGFWFGGQGSVDGVAEGAAPAMAFHFFRSPNPVRSRSRVAFELPSAERVGLSIFDVAGRPLQRQDLGRLPAGRHERSWNAVDEGGRPLPSGVYFLRLVAGRESATQKILILR